MQMRQNFWKSPAAVGVWLLAVAGIIFAMVVIGGLTRLTGSGLSITEWQPVMGAVPPLTDAAWAEAFARYQQIPQYILENRGMTLDAFKGIFWWEWTHRFLGRFLGFAFLLPFLWFAATGAIRRSAWPQMLLLFLLGGLQGLIGWWMVQSGLETRVSVSQYRLAIHLGAAILLLGAILWTALDYLRALNGPVSSARRGFVFIAVLYVQMLLGALVAGLHAGLIYNTWPDMNGRFTPESPFFAAPWWINFFENPGLAQFDHRLGAYAVAGVAAWVYARGLLLTGTAKKTAKLAATLTALQVGLGIFTLLLQAPQGAAAAHQILATALFCTAVWHAYELRYAASGDRA